MDNKSTFINAAIADTQGTIRAIDVKVGAIIVAILLPIQNLHRVFAHLNHLSTQSPRFIFLVAAVAFVATWLLALMTLVRALGAIDNPAKHVINSSGARGTFYSGGLYPLGMSDAFFNRSIIRASQDSASFLLQLPATTAEIENELAFEHMKLIYVRDIKLKRLYWGLRLSEAWLLIGVLSYLCSKYTLSY